MSNSYQKNHMIHHYASKTEATLICSIVNSSTVFFVRAMVISEWLITQCLQDDSFNESDREVSSWLLGGNLIGSSESFALNYGSGSVLELHFFSCLALDGVKSFSLDIGSAMAFL